MTKVFLKLRIALAVILWKCHFISATRQPINGANINVCENVADNLFIQDIEDCTKYIACIDGQAREQQCGSGLYFDVVRQACIASRQACLQCPTGRMINMPLNKTCDKYISCYYGQALLRKCENSQQFNKKTGKCDLSRNVDCVENLCAIYVNDKDPVYLPSAVSCTNYYICRAGQAEFQTCPDGLYFSRQCNCCDRSENVQCLLEGLKTSRKYFKQKFHRFKTNFSKLQLTPTLVGESNKVKCPSIGYFLYQYIEDPKYYYTCVDGKASLYICPNGFYFDDKLKRCIRNETLGELNKEQLVINANQTNDVSVTSADIANNFICPDFGTFIFPHVQKSRYYVCVDGHAISFACAQNHLFDIKTNTCQNDPTQNESNEDKTPVVLDEPIQIACPSVGAMKFAHKQKSKFYLCINGMGFVLACAKGSFFVPEMGVCLRTFDVKKLIKQTATDPMETTEIVDETFVQCPISGTFIYPHDERNLYYVCLEGKSIVFTCAEGLIFDNNKKTCQAVIQIENVDLQIPIALDGIVNIMCPAAGAHIFPHTERSKFYMCINGMGSLFACPKGSIFERETGTCEKEDQMETTKCPKFGTFLYPHNADKTRYFVCLEGSLFEFSCAADLIFDSKLNVCRKDSNEINYNRCPQQGTIKQPHVDGNKFYLCFDGFLSIHNCSKGDFFDAESATCRTPNNTIASLEIKNDDDDDVEVKESAY